MNKQELIKAIKNEPYEKGIFVDTIKFNRNWLLRKIEKLDEPEKVTIPQFVADWIRKCKTFKSFAVSLSFALQPSVWEANGLSGECIEWLTDAENQETFARAWLDGYTIEEEKKYKITLLNRNDGDLYLVNQNADLADKYGHFSPVVLLFTKGTNFSEKCYKLTKKEVVSHDFGWVFDCPGIKIEEVDD
ncbi:DUF1642 domain-containing protein [Streptococcus oralis]|uniref:DUF1642 domain-containing protein n=1 Tax=Streptococcus oralis TaxID=1303 RepID=UPI00066AF2B5|nr:DUF1642 domain-containing protein [Streptococcus oralis]